MYAVSYMEHTVVTLPSGKTAKIKNGLTGREKRALREVFLNEAELNTTAEGKQVLSGLQGTIIAKAEDAAIQTVVIEFDGSSDDILNRVLDLPSSEYDILLAKINEVTAEKKS